MRYRSDGFKQLERSYGSATTAVSPGDESKTVIAKSVLTADDNTIYISGHAMESSLTGGSLTYDIFLQRIKASDLTAGWTRSWGLDAAGQHDMASGLTTTFDGGKILLVG